MKIKRILKWTFSVLLLALVVWRIHRLLDLE